MADKAVYVVIMWFEHQVPLIGTCHDFVAACRLFDDRCNAQEYYIEKGTRIELWEHVEGAVVLVKEHVHAQTSGQAAGD